MKTLLILFIASALALSAQTVKVTIQVDAQTTEVTLAPAAVASLKAFLADQVEPCTEPDCTPKAKYTGPAELLIKHVMESLIVPLVQRYDAKVKAAAAEVENAKKSADALALVTASGTVVVK